MTPPTLHTVPQAALLIGISESWIRHNISRLPHTRPGGTRRVFFTDEQVAQIIRDSAVAPKTAKAPSRQPKSVQPRPKTEAPPSGMRIPQGNPNRSRLYRPESVA